MSGPIGHLRHQEDFGSCVFSVRSYETRCTVKISARPLGSHNHPQVIRCDPSHLPASPSCVPLSLWASWALNQPDPKSSVSELQEQQDLLDMYLESLEEYKSKDKRSWPAQLVRGTAGTYGDDIDHGIHKLRNLVQAEIYRLVSAREDASRNRHHSRAWSFVMMQEKLPRRFADATPILIKKRHKARFWKNPARTTARTSSSSAEARVDASRTPRASASSSALLMPGITLTLRSPGARHARNFITRERSAARRLRVPYSEPWLVRCFRRLLAASCRYAVLPAASWYSSGSGDSWPGSLRAPAAFPNANAASQLSAIATNAVCARQRQLL